MIETNSIARIRKIYQLASLSEDEVDENPLKQFEIWWLQAIESKIDEPNAMTLATSTLTGKPSARTVLLKGINEKGFLFFTNYSSRKGKEIEENPSVSLLFFWKELERQVRIEGKVQKISEVESDVYFHQRPVESRIGAWCSPQSQVIEGRKILEQNIEKYNSLFEDQNIPRPDFWGGYIVIPERMEFWQGRPGRLHDRLVYTSDETNLWKIQRLAP
jgi:pyridoxamine 5'-phosphate oxidase